MRLEEIRPPSLQEVDGASGISRSAARAWGRYFKACKRRFEIVESWLRRHFGEELSGRRVLDWGCALGGVAILLEDALPVQMHCGDVDEYSIRWLRSVHPGIATEVLPYEPHLPYGDASFDAIFGFSVLTHLPIDQQEPYLAELRRITAPGGMVLVTVAGYAACRANQRLDSKEPWQFDDPERLRQEGIVYAEHSPTMRENMHFTAGESYGQTFHSTEYVREVFARHFQIVALEEAGLGARQDVVVMTPGPG